jgi:hypothetical protein
MAWRIEYPQLAQAFVVTTPRILSFVERHRPPYIAKVYRPAADEAQRNPAAPGRIELWHPAAAEGPGP